MIKYLDKDFDEEIKNKRVLVDFYADWCGPCRMMGSILENLDDVEVLKVNVDNYPDLSQKYGVMSIPNLILFENGNPIKNHVGFMNEEDLKDFLKK